MFRTIAYFGAADLKPLGVCLSWNAALMWLNGIADAVLGLSCYAMPLALACFVRGFPGFAYNWLIGLFGLFLLCCGSAHFMAVWVLWHPAYAVLGLIKAAAAVTAVLSALILWPVVLRGQVNAAVAHGRAAVAVQPRQTQRRRRALALLRRSEQTLRMLLESVTDHAIYTLDLGGRVTSWNTGASRIKGYTASEILGRHFSLFYPPEDSEAGLPGLALEQAAREGKHESEGWRVHRDGTRFWAHSVIEPLRNESGEMIGYVKITRDITKQRQATQALEQARAALAQAQKMETVGHLTAGLAHDFNNLLTAIMGGADLLQRRLSGLDDTSQRVLQGILDTARRGATLVERLMAFSRKQDLKPSVLNLNRVIDDMADLLRQALGDQIMVEKILAGGLWRVFADRNQLENAVLNLAINARDAMPHGGRLTIESGNTVLGEAYAAAHDLAAGQYVMLAVSDTGTGMPPDVRDRAFEPFFTTKPEGMGTGLGLSQVYGFIKQSGGHVTIHSEPARGTTVKIYLPRHIGSDADEQDGEMRYAPAPVGHETILVLEEQADVRAFTVGALSHLGYRVLESGNRQHALALLKARSDIALLFTDIGLSGTNARLLVEETQHVRPGLRVLFTTGHTRNTAVAGASLGADAHVLFKPYTVEALARTLRTILDEASAAGQVSR